jgi:riboflavin-specific deaminase-like protein
MQSRVIEAIDEATWRRLLARETAACAGTPYGALIGQGSFVLGRIAQSIDGQIATAGGHSFWISGPADILHTHRLRALFEAVVVGAGTVHADDPQLTTRLCAGASPVRVVLDTERRLGTRYRVFESAATLLVCAQDCPGPMMHGAATVLAVPRGADGRLDLAAVLAALAERGLTRVFIEGGGVTVSRFLAAGLLDRLHLTIAPILLGAGVPAFTLPGVPRADAARRVAWDVWRLGDDLLLDIPLRA